MLAAQGRIGRQAEAVAHPAAGRRVGRSGLLQEIADQAMGQADDDDHQRRAEDGVVKMGRQRGVAQQREGDGRQHQDAQQQPRDRPPGAADHARPVCAFGRHHVPGAVAERRQGEQGHDGGDHQGAHRGKCRAVARAPRQDDIDELEAEADRHQPADRARQHDGTLRRERQHPPGRPARRQRRGGETDHQQEDDDADDQLRHDRVDRRRRRGRRHQLADQPDGEDRHQHQADAVDGGGDGAVALAGLDLIAAAEASTQEASQPPQGDGHHCPDRQRGEILLARAQCAQALAAPRRQRRRQGLQRRPELRPELAPHVGRQRRDVPVQQGVEHDLAAQLGQALGQLIGARDDHFALLELALADRRQLGQPGAVGLHRVGLHHRLAARLQLERRQKLLGVGQVVAGDGGGGAGRRAHVGHLLAQGVDLDRQQAGLFGPRGDAVELTRPDVDQLGERPLRRRHGLAERRAGAGQQQHHPDDTKPQRARGKGHLVFCLPDGPKRQV